MYDALDVAKYVIHYENSQGRSVSNLRLQKLLYFIQAQFLVTNHNPCFADKIMAWDFGPVVPPVYREYRVFGSNTIPNPPAQGTYGISAQDCMLINGILDKCSRYSTTELVSITHNQKPWMDAYRKGYDNTISLRSIQTFFGG